MSKSDSSSDDTLPPYSREKLRAVRDDELRMSLEKLAEKTNCDPRTLQRYEKGDYPIPLEFIRKLEKIRMEELERRARAIAKDKIDFNKFLVPGLQLIELFPVRKIAGTLFRMFIAMPKELLSLGEGGEPSPPPSMDPSGERPQPGTRPASASRERQTRSVLWLIAAGVVFCALMGGATLQVVLRLRNDLLATSRWARNLRVARDGKVERPATVPAQREPENSTQEQEPAQAPDLSETNGATNGNDDAGVQPKRSIKMPKGPYSWQKNAPCDGGETEERGGCWEKLADEHPPCPSMAVEDDAGRCLVPVPAKPKRTNSVTPEQ
jgi:transcriptional regulator with XRE-family HTH domain